LKDMHQEHATVEVKGIVHLADQIATFLRRNYKEPFSNEKLRDIFHFHPGHLARCMRKVFGCTPAEYLHRHRLEQGKLLLLQTNWSISRIAEEVGFEQLPYFTRCFRNYEGLTPSQFRQKFSKE
jgi:AraC-like DNA-binding protein